MCDIGTLQILLAASAASVTGAIIAIGVAAALNAGFFSAPGSPPAMITAAGFTVAAVASLVAARALVENYFQCMGALPACLGDYNNFINAITALITVLGIQATASLVAAGVAWIPWGGLAPMAVIAGALTVQALLIPSLTVFWLSLESCLAEAAASTTTPVITAASATLIAALGIGIIYKVCKLKNCGRK